MANRLLRAGALAAIAGASAAVALAHPGHDHTVADHAAYEVPEGTGLIWIAGALIAAALAVAVAQVVLGRRRGERQRRR